MSRHDNELSILANLRSLQVHRNFQVTRLLYPDKEERERVGKTIAELCGGDRSVLFRQLPHLLKSDECARLFAELTDLDSGLALRARNLLNTKAHEVELAELKAKSMQEYIGSLPMISEAELMQGIANGTVVNAKDELGRPLLISSEENYSGTFVYEPIATAWVDAQVLVHVLNRLSDPANDIVPSAKGLRLHQVIVRNGSLDLNWLRIPFPLGFQGCDFYETIWAEYLQVPWLMFEGCDFTPRSQILGGSEGAINAGNLEVAFELSFRGSRGLGQLFIPDSKIRSFSARNEFSWLYEGEKTDETSDEILEHISNQVRFRTFSNNAHFGTLFIPNAVNIPSFVEESELLPIDLKRGFSVNKVEGEYESILRLLQTFDADGRGWDVFADALSRSGREDDARELRIEYKRHNNRKRNPLLRATSYVFADLTVGYFHKPFRAIGWLVGIFLVTWAVAFGFHDQLMKSPLANDPIPANWLEQWTTTGAWSFMYALDSTFSPLSLGQLETMWPSSVWLVLALAALKAISIIMLGLFISGATTLVSKRNS